MKNERFGRRLGYAVVGWRVVWRNERSFRTQVLAGGIAGIAALASPSLLWTAIILLSVAFVLALECINAAIEYFADTLHPEIAPGIGAAKDAAAGAVLLASLGALAVAITFVVRLMT